MTIRAIARMRLEDLEGRAVQHYRFPPSLRVRQQQKTTPQVDVLPAQVQISRSLAPVKIRRRSAAAASGESKVRWFSSLGRCFDFGASPSSRHAMPTVSPSRMAAPSRSNSSGVRKALATILGEFFDLSCWIAVFRHEAASLGERVEAANDSEETIGLVRSSPI